jgi:glyoxylase-like metal-dependent hydrolase (beta-lactamase superfamily II)
MGYKRWKIDDRVSLIQETGVANFMRCNIWHISGRDFDLVIDTGMGLDSLKQWVMRHTQRPIKAIVTHSHFDHSGCLHEFDERLGHRAEAEILANPTNENTLYNGAWTQIGIIDLKQHPDFTPETYHVKAAPLTGYLDEGDVIDLGDTAYQILHLPGHSPGSIGLWDVSASTLFSGDALYDGELLDSLYHSDKSVYLQTLERIETLGVECFHAGHYPSFGKGRMQSLIDSYRKGNNSLGDIEAWYAENESTLSDMFSDQDWSEVAGSQFAAKSS